MLLNTKVVSLHSGEGAEPSEWFVSPGELLGLDVRELQSCSGDTSVLLASDARVVSLFESDEAPFETGAPSRVGKAPPRHATDDTGGLVLFFGGFLCFGVASVGNNVGTAFGFNFFQPSARCCSKLLSAK